MGNGFSQYAAGAAFAFGIAAAGAFGANGAMKENAAMTDASELPLWYSAPAETWEEALPIGNGRLGAMIFGGLDEERLQFNEDTLWTGRPRDYTHAGAAAHLGEVRRLLFAGRQQEAEALALETMMSDPLRQEAYQPFGDLRIEFPSGQGATEYRRDLDLDSAIAGVSYRLGRTCFKRQAFASAPAQAIVWRIEADGPDPAAFRATLASPHEGARLRRLDSETLAISGAVKGGAMRFEARLIVRAEGGSASVSEEAIEVDGARAATLILVAATNYAHYDDVSADPAARCGGHAAAIAQKSFEALRQEHIADHRQLFRRVSLWLGSSGDAAARPTNERISLAAARPDPELEALYFQYGRYLLIASSRPGTQPANLQGIWNDKIKPPWDSKWTVNINTEMNYWIAEPANLAECHEPLFDLIADVAETGRKTAQVHYDCSGWVLHHNTDIWRGSAPINAANHGIWVVGGAWLCQHLWERYLFSRDEEFLRERAYPLMKGAALFFADFLVEDPETGWLISGPSNSPEQGGLVMGPTMDHQIIRHLFGACIEASAILGVDAEFREQLKTMRARIAPNQIGRHGQLQEWMQDKDNPANLHRHVSHLWALHPGNEITPRATPELAEACRVTLGHRGDGGTGWSKAWKINFWARLHDGDHAHKMLIELLGKSTMPNMLDTHPPFQIDGNFGGASGILEMLMQSHAGEIELLPALPAAWPDGVVKGLRARGGFEVDIEWAAGRLARATIRSAPGKRCIVRYGAKTLDCELEPGGEKQLIF